MMQLGLFVSPVAFVSAQVPERWRALYALNPLAASSTDSVVDSRWPARHRSNVAGLVDRRHGRRAAARSPSLPPFPWFSVLSAARTVRRSHPFRGSPCCPRLVLSVAPTLPCCPCCPRLVLSVAPTPFRGSPCCPRLVLSVAPTLSVVLRVVRGSCCPWLPLFPWLSVLSAARAVRGSHPFRGCPCCPRLPPFP